MARMGLLIATDDWDKVDVFRKFLTTQSRSVWRTKGKYTPEYLSQIPYPINLYFFHRNIINFRAKCTGIYRGTTENWPLTDSPPEYRFSTTPYTLFIVINEIHEVKETHISNFPKWENPSISFRNGQLGILKVEDVLDAWIIG
jgi:hypothetical protein